MFIVQEHCRFLIVYRCIFLSFISFIKLKGFIFQFKKVPTLQRLACWVHCCHYSIFITDHIIYLYIANLVIYWHQITFIKWGLQSIKDTVLVVEKLLTSLLGPWAPSAFSSKSKEAGQSWVGVLLLGPGGDVRIPRGEFGQLTFKYPFMPQLGHRPGRGLGFRHEQA